MDLKMESGTNRRARLAMLLLFGITMAYFESAVVVYLRALLYPEGFTFPLRLLDRELLLVEVGRELASLAMLVTVALLAGRNFNERLAFFLMIFALWDIGYYLFLKLMLGWPESLTTFDLLFLVPAPWVGPVLSPLLVSLGLLAGAALILRRIWSGGEFAPNFREWAIASGGALLILLSYVLDIDAGVGRSVPRPYRWDLLLVGLASGLYALLRSLARTRPRRGAA